MDVKELAKGKGQWHDAVEFLVKTRFSIRDDGRPIEKTYEDVIERVTAGINEDILREKLEDFPTLARILKEVIVFQQPNIKRFLLDRKIIPSTPILMNFNSRSKYAGTFACYPMIPPQDSLESIFAVASLMAQVFKCGGGAGIGLSNLRPAGSLVDNGQGFASGPASFTLLYAAVASVVSQGAKRRGALMCWLFNDHPDWEQFISLKDNIDLSVDHPLNAVNISLAVKNTEEFLNSEQFEKVAEHAWKTGDPGLLFTDIHLRKTPIPAKFEPYHVNPCGEYQSVAGTVCNLLAINLLANALSSNSMGEFLHGVYKSAYYATLFGNFIIFAGGYPTSSFQYKTWLWRPVGIGFTGLHETMLWFGIDYESDLGVEFTRRIQRRLLLGTLAASATLAQKVYSEMDIVPKDSLEETHYHSDSEVYVYPYDKNTIGLLPVYIDRMLCGLTRGDLEKDGASATELEHFDLVTRILDEYGCLFNSITTSQMPTGTTSIFGFCGSTGVEPLWDLKWTRMIKDIDGTPRYFDLESLISDKVEELKPAIEISPEAQLRIMQAVQDYCHTAVSKTVNLPNSATVEDIKKVFRLAAELGLKSGTVYRDGCRKIQVLKRKDEEVKETFDPDAVEVRHGKTVRIRGTRTVYVTLNKFAPEDKQVREVFIIAGKSGTAIHGYNEAIGRLISFFLQRDPDAMEGIIKALSGIDCGEFYRIGKMTARSVPEAIAYTLLNYGIDSEKEVEITDGGDICPECGKATFYRMGGCRCCKNCGYSTC